MLYLADIQAGLPAVIKAIKGKGSTAAQIDDVIARAQWFYFARKHQSSVPFETYLRCRSRETESQPMKSPTASPTTATSMTLAGASPVMGSAAVLPVSSAPAIDATPAAAPASVSVTSAPPPPHPSAAVSSAEIRVAEAASVAGEPVAAAASTPAPADPTTENMKFTDIVRLIAEGRADEVPVPVIPDGINEEAPSVSTMSARPKPWERAQAEEPAAGAQ